MPHIRILPHAELCPLGDDIEAPAGTSICEALLENGIAIEHACEMSCACTTCHVIVREGFASLGEMDESEEDLLDRAWGLTPTSRLSCQAILSQQDVIIELPKYDQPRTREPLRMNVLGIESSCDETGVALVEAGEQGVPRLRAQALHSQADMHRAYGGVVPELASRDHIRRVLPLTRQVLAQAGAALQDIDLVAYTRGPRLAGALLVGAGVAVALAEALQRPALGVHHLEGHLLSPFLSADPPQFPFVALLVSGGHTQLMRVDGVGRYALLGETVDDAAGEAFDKSAKLLGLGYPGGPALAALARQGRGDAFELPRPLLAKPNLDFSFAGLKTAVAVRLAKLGETTAQQRADMAASVQQAIVDVLCAKSLRALQATGLPRLVVAGGVGANLSLRSRLDAETRRIGARVHYPEPALCTDNGAMIALAAAMRLQAGLAAQSRAGAFDVRPRWELAHA